MAPASRHALARFAERFPGLDPRESLKRAAPLSAAQVFRLLFENPHHKNRRVRLDVSTFHRDPVTGAVWIEMPDDLCPGERVLATVIELHDPQDRRKT